MCLLFSPGIFVLIPSYLAWFQHINIDKWSTLANRTIVLLKNALYIPCPISNDKLPFSHADGSWGLHKIALLPQAYDPEHPYLSHILIDSHDCFHLPRFITCLWFKDSNFYRYTPLPCCSYIKETIGSMWKNEIYSYWQCILHLYDELQATHPGPYRAPTIAIGCAKDTLFIITHNTMLYHEAVKYTCRLQCFIAEIQAFLIWGNKILGHSLNDNQPVCWCFYGTCVASLPNFQYLPFCGVPAFYLTGLFSSKLPSSHHVCITELAYLWALYMDRYQHHMTIQECHQRKTFT